MICSYLNKQTSNRLSQMVVCVLSIALLTPLAAQAQGSAFPIAETISIADSEVSYGDVILYDRENELYRRAQGVNDPRVFGVVVEDPSFLLETNPEQVPVAQEGVMPVNVTLENGDISTGDPLVTSTVPGMAMRAGEDRAAVFGFATESFTSADVEDEETEDVPSGAISVEVGGERLDSFLEENAAQAQTEDTDQPLIDTGRAVRFGIAALVALGSIFITFYTFLASIRSGVASVGRNPRAKAAIRSMVILNIVLALVISIAGVFFAISLLVVPS